MTLSGNDENDKIQGDIYVKPALNSKEAHYICELKAKLPHYKVVKINDFVLQVNIPSFLSSII